MKYFVAVGVLILLFAFEMYGQITEAPIYSRANNSITVRFIDVVEKVNDKDVSGGIDCPVIYFQQGTEEIFLYCDANLLAVGNEIELKNFRTSRNSAAASNQMVDLVNGSISNCDDKTPGQPTCLVKGLAANENRPYFIHWPKKVKVRDQAKALTVFLEAKIGANLEKPPTITAEREGEKADVFRVVPKGLTAEDLIQTFEKAPGLIKVAYDFPDSDPAHGFETYVTDVNCVDGTKQMPCKDKHGLANHGVLLTLAAALPIRPAKYTTVIKIPWQPLRNAGIPFPGNEWKLPEQDDPAKDFLTSGVEITRLPNKPERSKSEYAFEAGFTSTVGATDRKRSNVGIFGLTIKPSIGLRSFGTGRESSGRNGWLALRPLLIADVDTQKISKSKSPNRVQLGVDLEWGNNFGLDFTDEGVTVNKKLLRQLIWTNGLRYDSDRDFKLQTMYWHTELGLGFRKFEQSFDQRLFRWLQAKKGCQTITQEECKAKQIPDCSTLTASRCGDQKEPFVSSYFVRPGFGYELGGTIRRDARVVNTPTNNILRPFFHLPIGVELKRVAKFSIDDTYYYLQNASRRKNRNYFETVFELNTGRLSGIDLNGFSNSIFLKFQRGDQPPVFGPVNALSLGFKIYK